MAKRGVFWSSGDTPNSVLYLNLISLFLNLLPKMESYSYIVLTPSLMSMLDTSLLV